MVLECWRTTRGNRDVLVFDLRNVSGDNSEVDVLRSLLQFAQAMTK